MMGSMCCKINGVVVLVAGLALLAPAVNVIDAGTGNIVAGVMLVIYGGSKLAHSMGMCGACASCKAPAPAAKRR